MTAVNTTAVLLSRRLMEESPLKPDPLYIFHSLTWIIYSPTKSIPLLSSTNTKYFQTRHRASAPRWIEVHTIQKYTVAGMFWTWVWSHGRCFYMWERKKGVQLLHSDSRDVLHCFETMLVIQHWESSHFYPGAKAILKWNHSVPKQMAKICTLLKRPNLIFQQWHCM